MRESRNSRPAPGHEAGEPSTWLTIRVRILLLSSLLVAVLIGIGATNWMVMRWLANSADAGNSAVATSMRMVNLARTIQVDFKKQVQEWKNILLRGNDPKQMRKYLGKFKRQETRVRDNLESLRRLMATDRMDVAPVDSLLESHAQLGRAYREALKAYDPTDQQSAFRVDRQVKGIDRAPTRLMDELVDQILNKRMTQVHDVHDAEADRFDQVQLIVITLSLAGLALTIASAGLLIRSVVKPLETVLLQTRTVAQGNLTKTIEPRSRDEIGRLMQAAEEMRRNLGNVIHQIQRIGRDVSAASGEIADGNRQLAGRTVQQAASLKAATHNMLQVTTLVNQNADTARKAWEMARQTGDSVLQSAAVVEEVGKAMQEIRDTSRNIAEIISVIDDIAFQTNLLALNAAVEAAHAGEHGKGFAVVASEVRDLAQRSAVAARQIKGLISASEAKVDSGASLADRSGEALRNVVREFESVSDLISSIAAAASEQAAGVDGVTREVGHMESMTQDNSAMVKAVSELSESMEDRARELERLASYFQVAPETRAHSAPERSGRSPSSAAPPPRPAMGKRRRAA